MESYGLQPKWPRLPFVGLDFLPQFCYFGHNFLTKMLESQPMTLRGIIAYFPIKTLSQ